MTTPTERAPGGADWAHERERSNLATLRFMRWIAVALGRPIARLVLHPITLYFLAMNGKARRASRQYLARALGRRPTAVDSYRHIHAFAATVLDRVYFLQEQHARFDVRANGIDPVHALLGRGAGVFFAGAHFGSFEALRANAQLLGEKVAMLMYEDNARLINRTLAALAPKATLHTIPLGRPGAMLALRRWLDDGGMVGLLADRTLATRSERSRSVTLDFLGAPATFSDGPFRLAAMLRRPLYFMAGIYLGGNRYELRFELLADFSAPDEDGHDADALIDVALTRYAALLERLCVDHPYNWFNFYDFWSDDDGRNGAA